MQKTYKIKTPDNFTIYGTLDLPDKKSDVLIIFIHGLTGNQNEHIFYNAAKFFPKRGFSTFRFNLYDWQAGARDLTGTTIKDHVIDLELVIKEMKKNFRMIFLIGHSLGGIVILSAKIINVNGVILWDPSFNLKGGLKNDLKFDPKIKKYIANWGIDILVSSEMITEFDKLDLRSCLALIKKIKNPIKIIVAQSGQLLVGGKQYFMAANEPKEFIAIKNATHTFDEEGTEENLFEETLKFIKKHS